MRELLLASGHAEVAEELRCLRLVGFSSIDIFGVPPMHWSQQEMIANYNLLPNAGVLCLQLAMYAMLLMDSASHGRSLRRSRRHLLRGTRRG